MKAFHGNEWMKKHMLYKADTPRSRTQNICFRISISAVILKLMVKITSIFFSYRFLRIAWPDIFSHSDHFPTPNPRLLCFFFLCHGRLVVGYVWCRRGSFNAAVDHCRSCRLLVTTFVASSSHPKVPNYAIYAIKSVILSRWFYLIQWHPTTVFC